MQFVRGGFAALLHLRKSRIAQEDAHSSPESSLLSRRASRRAGTVIWKVPGRRARSLHWRGCALNRTMRAAASSRFHIMTHLILRNYHQIGLFANSDAAGDEAQLLCTRAPDIRTPREMEYDYRAASCKSANSAKTVSSRSLTARAKLPSR